MKDSNKPAFNKAEAEATIAQLKKSVFAGKLSDAKKAEALLLIEQIEKLVSA